MSASEITPIDKVTLGRRGAMATIAMAAASVVVHQLGTTGTASPGDLHDLVCTH